MKFTTRLVAILGIGLITGILGVVIWPTIAEGEAAENLVASAPIAVIGFTAGVIGAWTRLYGHDEPVLVFLSAFMNIGAPVALFMGVISSKGMDGFSLGVCLAVVEAGFTGIAFYLAGIAEPSGARPSRAPDHLPGRSHPG